MANALTQTSLITLVFLGLIILPSGSYGTILSIANNCSNTVWPVILSTGGTLPLASTGFALQAGDSNTVSVPPGWSGRLWGRTLCSQNTTGKFSCVTGDCGSTTTVECAGGNAAPPPVTLVEFTLNGADGLDYFDISLSDGFNLPVRVEPRGGITGAGNCGATSCANNLNQKCPVNLMVMKDGVVVGCKSLCEPGVVCSSTVFSDFAKSKCPEAYYDHGSFTCASADYTIIFCPIPSRSLIKRGKQKKNVPAAVGNSGGHVDSPVKKLLLLMLKILIPTSVSTSLIICCKCNTWYRSPKREWGINMVVGQTKGEIIAHNPQTAIVEMACNILIFYKLN